MTAGAAVIRELLRVAARSVRVAHDAEDVVQDVLLAAVRDGRDPADPAVLPWLRGAVRKHVMFVARTSARRRRRDDAWAGTLPDADPPAAIGAAVMPDLPAAQRTVLALALAGLDRREVASLLGISDVVLRQRLAALRRSLAAAGADLPDTFARRAGHLRHGLIRHALLPLMRGRASGFASHDPDGHLFVVVGASPASQIGRLRQQEASKPRKETLP